MPIEVRPAAGRFVTRADGRTTWHSFSFGMHYDPHDVGFGALQALNDELLPVGTGYPDHPHRDTEIVTLVLTGALRHRDSRGNTGVLLPGDVQVLSSGSGVVHAEVADPDATEPTRFLQAWVRPDESGLVPSYAGSRVQPSDGLLCVASDHEDGTLPLHTRGASLHIGELGDGVAIDLPDAPRLHVFVAAGVVVLGDRELGSGDSGLLLDEGGRPLRATHPHTQVMVWALP